ncbi:MAG: hypothetical protein K5779_05505 [Saccharofermentans sp.]|nr:hypothetical protein [Saccharofermentans sp.]
MIFKQFERIKRSNIAITISVILFTVKYFLDRSSIPGFIDTIYSDILLIASVVPLLIFLARHMATNLLRANANNHLKNSVIVLGVLVVSMAIYVFYPYFFIVYTLLLVVAAKYLDENYILSLIKYSMLFMLLLLAALSIVGIIPNVTTEAGRYNLGLQNRMFGWYFLNYCAIDLYNRKHKKIRKYVVLTSANIVIFLFTKTKLSLFLFLILLVLCIVEDKGWIIGKKVRFLLCGIYYVLTVLTIFFTLFYAKFPILETIFSGRFRFGMRVLSAHGISLLPRNIQYYSVQLTSGLYTMYVDSGYLDLIIRFGIIIAVLVLTFYTLFMYKTIKTGNYRLFIWLLIIAIFNFVNSSFLNIFYDCSIILLWHEFTRRRNEPDRSMLNQDR